MTATAHTNCLKCGRKLSAKASTAAGYGRTCRAKVRAAALAEATAGMKPETVAKASQLIADGGIVRIRGTVFKAASTDGSRVYRTAPQGCTCPAGIKGKHLCYHRAAAAMLLAA
jgi:hypothetical protein